MESLYYITACLRSLFSCQRVLIGVLNNTANYKHFHSFCLWWVRSYFRTPPPPISSKITYSTQCLFLQPSIFYSVYSTLCSTTQPASPVGL